MRSMCAPESCPAATAALVDQCSLPQMQLVTHDTLVLQLSSDLRLIEVVHFC